MSRKAFILDGYGVLYRNFFAIPTMLAPDGDPTNALFGLCRFIYQVKELIDPSLFVVVLDGHDNKQRRAAIYPMYKSNRGPIDNEFLKQIVKVPELCEALGVATVCVDGQEADDVIASIVKWLSINFSGEVIVSSYDKDLMQLIGEDVRFIIPDKDMTPVDDNYLLNKYGVKSNQLIDFLSIVGDSSDCIKGVPGIGPKGSAGLLKQYGSLESALSTDDSNKKVNLLKDHSDQVLLAKKLITLDDTAFPVQKFECLTAAPLDVSKCRRLFSAYGFKSFLKKLPNDVVADGCEIKVNDQKAFERDIGSYKGKYVWLFFPQNERKEQFFVKLLSQCGYEYDLCNLQWLLNLLAYYGLNIVTYNYKKLCLLCLELNITSPACFADLLLVSYLLDSDQDHSLESILNRFSGGLFSSLWSLSDFYDRKHFSCIFSHIDSILDVLCAFVESNSMLLSLEHSISSILSSMEHNGIHVDTSKLSAIKEEVESGLKEIRTNIFSMAGEEFNLNSPKQVKKILFDKLKIDFPKKLAKSGKLSTNYSVLSQIDHPVAYNILSYRELEKVRSTYIDSFEHQVDKIEGKIHAYFEQAVTVTGRLSCRRPNLQNVPLKGKFGVKIRECFVPAYGCSFISLDYSQIEVRIMAHLSKDKKLIQDLTEGKDIHSETAKIIFNNECVTSDQRKIAKAVNFGIMYGQTGFGLARLLNIPDDQARQLIEAYLQAYPMIHKFMQESYYESQENGFVTTLLGRKRFIKSSITHNERAQALRLAVNSKIQGSGADLIKLAMVSVRDAIVNHGLCCKIILQIHDELLLQVEENDIQRTSVLAKKCMESCFSLDVPLSVEMSIGSNWGYC